MLKLYHADVADRLRIAEGTWRRYCASSLNRRRIAPLPDGVDTEAGHVRPWWKPETIDNWRTSRPGPGTRTDLKEKPR